MISLIYNNCFFKKWEILLLTVLTLGRRDDTKLFFRNFSFLVVIGFGTFFFQLVNGYEMHEYPNFLKSLFSIGSLFVTCCFFTIIIDYKRNDKIDIINSNVNATLKVNIYKELNHKIKLNKDALKDVVDISIEDKFKDFFLDDKYICYKQQCIQNGLLEKNSLKWLSGVTNFAVLYHKLKNNNLIKVDKKIFTQKDFVLIAKKLHKIDGLDSSLISHYKPGKPNYYSGGYEDFYKKNLSFIGPE